MIWHKKEENNIVKNIYDLYIMGIKIFIPFLIIFFGLLDYLTFTDIFHFKYAAILDIYIFSINLFDSSLIITLLLIPIFIMLSIFVIAIIAVSPVYMIRKKQNILKSPNKYFSLFIFITILLSSSAFVLYVDLYFKLFESNILLYFISTVLPLFLSYFFVSIHYLFFEKNKNWFIKLSLFILWLIILTYGYLHTKEYIFYLIGLMLVPSVSSIVLSELFLTENLRNIELNDSKFILVIFSVIILLSEFLFGNFHNSNIKTWSKIQTDQNSTTNLFLNKKFLSEISPYDDILLSKNKKINELRITKETKYLPISSNMKLYFVFQKDTNATKVFAIEKKYYKDKYVYDILHSGCINCPKDKSKEKKKKND
ncbi:hypothetical protein [Sulfurimonas sp. CS5]|uniref:hypothetical protein n=1 Tax=Sulfurimonas sp. CS5 TaxID=3391145 RepID=UPI0039E81925